jgi:UTP--glucose-1-phosphate uridylyltransferase
MSKKVRKAIIPAAGFGTRFLPATKAQPKEMLPIVDKPIIQYVVEDAVSAGIEDIIIVTGWHKRSIEDHFDYPYELEKRLEQSGKNDEIEKIRDIANLANFYYVRQKGPQGNLTPIWNARELIDDEPFLVLWGDDFIEATPTRSQQLIQAYEQYGGHVIVSSLRKSAPEDYKRYGYAGGKEVEPGILKINEIVEKPGPGKIDSDYAVVSGYLFQPSFFEAAEEVMKRATRDGLTRELNYIDAINVLLEQNKACYALEIKDGKFYDCGNKLEYLKAVVEFGLRHDDLRKDFAKYLSKLQKELITKEQVITERLKVT